MRRFLWLGWRLIQIAVPLSLVAAGVVAGICWGSGHRSWQEYAQALYYTAILALVAGVVSSGIGARRGPLPPESWHVYGKQRIPELGWAISYFLLGLLVALLLFVLAVIVAIVAPV